METITDPKQEPTNSGRQALTKKVVRSIIFLILIILGLLFYYLNRSDNAQAVINVLNQNAQAAKDSTVRIPNMKAKAGQPPPTRLNSVHYASQLRTIDASHCPKKFQMAWLEYMQAWEREAQQTPGRVLGEVYLGMIGLATKSHSLQEMTTRPIEAADAVENAWQNLERVALEYDVSIRRQTSPDKPTP